MVDTLIWSAGCRNPTFLHRAITLTHALSVISHFFWGALPAHKTPLTGRSGTITLIVVSFLVSTHFHRNISITVACGRTQSVLILSVDALSSSSKIVRSSQHIVQTPLLKNQFCNQFVLCYTCKTARASINNCILQIGSKC